MATFGGSAEPDGLGEDNVVKTRLGLAYELSCQRVAVRGKPTREGRRQSRLKRSCTQPGSTFRERRRITRLGTPRVHLGKLERRRGGYIWSIMGRRRSPYWCE
jgi:hypothetical protein